MTRDGCHYAGSPEWSVAYEHGYLIASGGADEVYSVEDVSSQTAAELAELWEHPLDRERLSPDAARVVQQLLSVGAVVRDLEPRPPARIALAFCGAQEATFVDALSAEAGGERLWRLAEARDEELTLVVRTGGRLVEMSDGTDHPVSGPHLLLDTAYHHTLSLGPLVFPGETACLACLAGRIGQYWGDPVPPARPAARRWARLAAALAALELDKIAAGDYGLVNATVAFDLGRHEVKRNALYKLPWCPVCGDRERGQTVGLVPLPWVEAA